MRATIRFTITKKYVALVAVPLFTNVANLDATSAVREVAKANSVV